MYKIAKKLSIEISSQRGRYIRGKLKTKVITLTLNFKEHFYDEAHERTIFVGMQHVNYFLFAHNLFGA